MLKKLLFALAALGVSSAAMAHDGWRHESHRYRYYAPRPVYVVPAPRVVYAPAPRVAYPYYAAPVVVRPAPVYAPPAFSIRFNFPL